MSLGTMRVEGLERVLSNLNEEVRGIKFRTKKGMISAGFLIQRESQKRTPVDTSNLRASAFVVWGPGTGVSNKTFSGPDASEVSSRHAQVVGREGASLPAGISNPQVTVGHSVAYAIYVHENTMANHRKSKKSKSGIVGIVQVGEAKFLEKAIDQNRGRIVETIRREAEVK